MLMITRRIGERIVIGEGIEIVVTEIHRRSVRLAIRAPAGHLIFRGEVWDAIAKANREAASAAIDEDALGVIASAPPADEEPTPGPEVGEVPARIVRPAPLKAPASTPATPSHKGPAEHEP